MHQPERIFFISTFIASFGMGWIATGYVPSLIKSGISVPEVALINGCFWLIIVLAEVPTGVLADRLSRAWSVALGSAIQAFAGLLYLSVNSPGDGILAEVLLGIGMAFISGADEAWLTDAIFAETAIAEERVKRLSNALINKVRIEGVAAITGGIIGSFFCAEEPTQAIVWIPFSVCLGICAIFELVNMRKIEKRNQAQEQEKNDLEKEEKEESDKNNEKETKSKKQTFREAWKNYGKTLEKSAELLKTNPSLQWAAGLHILFGGVVLFNFYWNIYIREQVDPSWLGVIWILIYLPKVLASSFAERINTKELEQGNLVFALVMTSTSLIVMGWTGNVAILLVFIVIHEIGRGLYQPFMSSFIQHRIKEGSYRATYTSLNSLIGRSGSAFCALLVYVLTKNGDNPIPTIALIWVYIGIWMTGGTALLWFFKPHALPLRQEEEETQEDPETSS